MLYQIKTITLLSLTLAFSSCFSSNSNAEESETVKASDVEENKVELTIKPKVCVLEKINTQCVDTVVIAWNSRFVISPCLESDSFLGIDLPCWENQTKGQFEVQLRTQKPIKFLLVEGGKTLATTSLRVFSPVRPRKRSSRRRNPWSIF